MHHSLGIGTSDVIFVKQSSSIPCTQARTFTTFDVKYLNDIYLGRYFENEWKQSLDKFIHLINISKQATSAVEMLFKQRMKKNCENDNYSNEQVLRPVLIIFAKIATSHVRISGHSTQ